MSCLENTLYLFGPELDKALPQLNQTNLNHIKTVVIDDHFDFEMYSHLDRILPRSAEVFSDFFFDTVCDRIQPFPAWLAYHDFTPMIQLDYSPGQTVDCFNFIVNKARPWRVFAVKLLEYFNLTTQCYTLNSAANYFLNDAIVYQGRVSQIKKFFSCMKEKDGLPKKFKPRMFGKSFGYEDRVRSWNSFLKSLVFSPSAIAIITEPYEITWIDHLTYSEKTIYAMLGLNFPLWVGGGIGQADTWKSVGFDVFDDVIDHSYQYHKDPVERSFYAVHDNLQILYDVGLASTLREKYLSRLVANQQLCYGENLKAWLQAKLKLIDDKQIQQGLYNYATRPMSWQAPVNTTNKIQ